MRHTHCLCVENLVKGETTPAKTRTVEVVFTSLVMLCLWCGNLRIEY